MQHNVKREAETKRKGPGGSGVNTPRELEVESTRRYNYTP